MILLRDLGIISHIDGFYWKKIDFGRSYLDINICKLLEKDKHQSTLEDLIMNEHLQTETSGSEKLEI